MNKETIKKTKYFAIFKDRSIAEYIDLDSSDKSQDDIWVLIRDEFRYFKNPGNGFDWRISNYIFLTPDKKEFKYEFNKWHIEEIDIYYVSSSRIDFDVVVSDPQNRIRRIKENFIQSRKFGHFDTNDIGLILQSIDLFQSIARYNNWIEYDVQTELIKLREENEQLRADIKELKKNKNN